MVNYLLKVVQRVHDHKTTKNTSNLEFMLTVMHKSLNVVVVQKGVDTEILLNICA